MVKIVPNGGSREVAAADVAAGIRKSLKEHVARWGLSIENCDVQASGGDWPVVVDVTTAEKETLTFSFDREPYESHDPEVHASGAMNVIAAVLDEKSTRSTGPSSSAGHDDDIRQDEAGRG